MNIFPLIIVFLFSLNLSAQIVNIEDKRVNRVDSIAWFGFLNVGFNVIQNGKSVVSINGDLRIEHVRKRHTWLALTNYNLGKVEKQDVINDGFQHFRYNYEISSGVTWEAFTQTQFNEAIRLQLRWLLGGGPRFNLIRKENHEMNLGALYMYEYNEEHFKETAVTFYHRDHRLSCYLSFVTHPTPNFSISGTSYFQPLLNNWDDLRFSSQTSLIFHLTKKLHYSASFSLLYDSRVPETVANTIYNWKNGLRWEF